MTPSVARSTAPRTPSVPDANVPSAAASLVELAEVLATYRTCELATVTRSGTPVTWPAVAWLDRAAGQLVLTTSIGLPRKAFNLRRDPRVALLFSDPTGSGRSDLPQVLVRGTAECPDEIRTSPRGMEAYWQDLWRHQPGSAGYGATPLDRWFFDFYYMRLVITVTPTSVTTRTPLVRSTRLAPPKPVRRDTTPYAAVTRRLPEFHDAVLATVAGDAPPVLRRVRPAADPATGSFRLDGAEPGELAGVTSANLLLHSHDAKLARLRMVGLVGTLDVGEERVLLQPDRVLGAAEATTPLAMVRTVRRLRQTTQRYLDHRGLDRPVIPWAEYRALARPDQNG
jgi:general stress protein 26